VEIWRFRKCELGVADAPDTGSGTTGSLRILVLSQHFWPEQFRINSFVEDLRRAGAEVIVLTGQPNYPSGRVFDGYRARGIQVERHPRGYEIFRVPLIPRGKSGAVRLILNYLSFLFAAMIAGPVLLRERRIDVVFVYATSPVFQGIAGLVLRRFKRSPVVLWVQDLWPHVLVSTGFVRNRRVLSLIESAVSALYRRVDLILAQSEAFAEAIRPHAGKVPVAYFPNPGDLSDGPRHEPAVRLPEGFNVVFAGNLGRAQALDTVVEAATLLGGESDVRIILFGSGAMEDWIREQIAQRGLDNLVLAGRVPPEAMPGVYSQASAVLLTLANDEMLSKTVPSKLQSYLGAGVPVIAAAMGEPARVVRESGGGIECPPEDPAALAASIRKLASMPRSTTETMRRRGREYYEAHFEPRRLAEALLEQLRTLVHEHNKVTGER
jgi:glycosyltransferase involved in cell wall biosynthesis